VLHGMLRVVVLAEVSLRDHITLLENT